MLDWKSLLYSDKPQSLSVKNFLIRKMSTAMNVSEKIITTVIDHQFVTLIDNMPTCNSLELSGFGKFMFHKHKAPRMMVYYMRDRESLNLELSNCTDPQVKKRLEFRLSKLMIKINVLNQKLQTYENQFCTTVGGMAQSVDSSSGDEGTHPTDSI